MAIVLVMGELSTSQGCGKITKVPTPRTKNEQTGARAGSLCDRGLPDNSLKLILIVVTVGGGGGSG